MQHHDTKAQGQQPKKKRWHTSRRETATIFARQPNAIQQLTPIGTASIAHHSLTTRLARGYPTVKQLLEGDLMYIRVKREFHQHPILVQSLHAGTELDLESTLPASALTRYLKDCARRNGFPDTVTLYSLRRQAASDFNAKYGADTARQLLGHAPGTRTLEKHYLKFAYQVAIVSTRLGEDEDENDELAVLQERAGR
ncbi:hypothetical protein PMZ80_001353 [Knufia obscura]|uniref:Tyr recombinase domain-containing protein n=1 Tax=Knufia obscura TaxID=1635080 RepID=A0ABR0S2W8_9EURO|nr:hypothetical protein PMZ80_001353 [Knufia obscura]